MLENQAPVGSGAPAPGSVAVQDSSTPGQDRPEGPEAAAPISERQRPFRLISKVEKLGPLESRPDWHQRLPTLRVRSCYALMEAPGPGPSGTQKLGFQKDRCVCSRTTGCHREGHPVMWCDSTHKSQTPALSPCSSQRLLTSTQTPGSPFSLPASGPCFQILLLVTSAPTVARGGRLGEQKAANLRASTLVVRLPL